MDKYLNEQLTRLRTDHIDFYLVHGLNDPFWKNLSALKVTEFLDDAIADGRIRYAGFSFHDNTALFKEIVDSYDWTFAQMQYNFMDEQYQAGTEGLRYAAKKGLGIVVMEPVRGGLLARDLKGVAEIWQTAETRHDPAEWALRWVWNHPEVTVVLSGMSTMEQVRQNVALAKTGVPDSLSKKEIALFGKVKKELKKRIIIPCTGWRYLRALPERGEHPGVLRDVQPRAHLRGRGGCTAALYDVPRRFLRWHTPLRLLLPGVRGVRGEVPPGSPDPRKPQKSGGLFREIKRSNRTAVRRK